MNKQGNILDFSRAGSTFQALRFAEDHKIQLVMGDPTSCLGKITCSAAIAATAVLFIYFSTSYPPP